MVRRRSTVRFRKGAPGQSYRWTPARTSVGTLVGTNGSRDVEPLPRSPLAWRSHATGAHSPRFLARADPVTRPRGLRTTVHHRPPAFLASAGDGERTL